jgi:N-acetylglucosaminyldiphosphoundecaprenol N-acetyl-beta-D-mannosaminyltransferase
VATDRVQALPEVGRQGGATQWPAPSPMQRESGDDRCSPAVLPADRVTLTGVQIDNLDEQGVINHILEERLTLRGGWMINPNVDVLRQVHADTELQSLVKQANLVIADGTPLIWASRIRKTPLAERVPGSQLIWSLSGAAAERCVSVFLLGGTTGVAERAGLALRLRYPNLKLAGTHCPPFGFESDAEQMQAIFTAVESSSPGIVFCGLGFPKQERLMAILASRFPGMWFIGSGASLTMAAGDVPRAPEWMQSVGLEWLYRLVQEPRRLFSRYIIHDIPFALRLMLSSLRDRQSDPASAPLISQEFDPIVSESILQNQAVESA